MNAGGGHARCSLQKEIRVHECTSRDWASNPSSSSPSSSSSSARGSGGAWRRGMRNEEPRAGKGSGFFSLRNVSGYLRIVSSGASNVASTIKSAGASVASSIAESEGGAGGDQVQWAGFDELEAEGNSIHQVLLLGFSSGFQVWDVEEGDDVHELVSRHDGPASCLQMLRIPSSTIPHDDTFADARPMLAIASKRSIPGGFDLNSHAVHFYSLKAHGYVHSLDFSSPVYAIRCSSRLIAISQYNQIHFFDAATLEREYTILTSPVPSRLLVSGSVAYGPLALGPRWLAYSGSPVAVPDTGRVSPKQLGPPMSLLNSSSPGLVVSSLAMLGDIGYKKLSKYCSELLPDAKLGDNPRLKANSSIGRELQEEDGSIGMVIVRDILSRSVLVQFRAHTSSIAALCFDPSGTLLVTASVLGHNINVFCILPSSHGGSSSGSERGFSYVHLYQLQRGLTNAVIPDISFSNDSRWIMVSSSRGTSHLFAIPSAENSTNLFNHSNKHEFSPPAALSAISRIRNGKTWWRSAVNSSVAAAASIASVFHDSTGVDDLPEPSPLRRNSHLLVFSPSGAVIQYLLSHVVDGSTADDELLIEATRKWDICHKQNRRERGENLDIYGDQGSGGSSKHGNSGRTKRVGPKPVLATEERQHLYISEVELSSHVARTPLWVKSEISFHAWVNSSLPIEVDGFYRGEIDLERVPTRAVMARAKDLIPVFDSFQIPQVTRSHETMTSILSSSAAR